MSFEKEFFDALKNALLNEWYAEDSELQQYEYIAQRVKEIARELVEITDSNVTLSECLKNLETHTHDIIKQYGECDRMFYECSKPVY